MDDHPASPQEINPKPFLSLRASSFAAPPQKCESLEDRKARFAGNAATFDPSSPGIIGAATPSRYWWTYRGVSFDFYRLCQITGVTSDPGKHAMKKIIRAGRSVKTLRQDVEEARDALNRWIEMIDEDDADQPKQTTPE